MRPYRQASPSPARHRPGARSARRERCLFLLLQTAGDFNMVLTKQSRLRVEQLDDRCLPSASVVLEWNQLTLNAIRQAGMSTSAGVPRPGDHAGGRLRFGQRHRPVVRALPRPRQSVARRLTRSGGGPGRPRRADGPVSCPGRHLRRGPRRRPSGHPTRPGPSGHRGGARGRPANPRLADSRRLRRDGALHAGDRPGRLAADPARLPPQRWPRSGRT